jgi:sugar/nucleoside kinase (ribokinase family)
LLREGFVMADVGCAGILVSDTFCGPMRRLPKEGELLAIDQMHSGAGGCAANVAADLVKQGIEVDVCGCVGTDPSAELLLQNLRDAGVGCGQVWRLAALPTSRTVILLVEGEDRRYIHVFGANAGFEVHHIRRDWVDGLQVFYFGGLCATPAIRAAELAELLGHCRERGIATVVDVVVPQGQRGMAAIEPLLPWIDYFLPNDDEAERLTGCTGVEQQAAKLLACGVGTVVITRGAEGATAARGRQRWQVEAYRVDGVDPSGSGDAFAAGLITGILRKWDVAEMLRYAAALGASATTAIGTTGGVFDAQQARSYLDRNELRIVGSELW